MLLLKIGQFIITRLELLGKMTTFLSCFLISSDTSIGSNDSSTCTKDDVDIMTTIATKHRNTNVNIDFGANRYFLNHM